jgi:DNA polymerase III epsilon subunit-like protein
MGLFVVDVEADGPAPGLYSLVNFGIVEVSKKGVGRHFYGECAPIVDAYIPDSLAVSGFTREQHLAFESAESVMLRLVAWLQEVNGPGRCTLVSDNPAFDYQFMNYYLWRYANCNPFGHSARRIGDFHAGLMQDFFAKQRWKKLRKTSHTHNPLDDAMGNAEALVLLMAQADDVKAQRKVTQQAVLSTN